MMYRTLFYVPSKWKYDEVVTDGVVPSLERIYSLSTQSNDAPWLGQTICVLAVC